MRVIGATVAATVLAMALATLPVVRPSRQTEPVAHPTGASPYAMTLRAVQRLLAAAPTPPGAAAVNRAPAPVLKRPPSQWVSPNRVDKAGWWTAPGTTGAALQYVRSHLRAGLTVTGSSESGSPTGPTLRGVEVDATGRKWTKPEVYTGLRLLISVTQLGDRVGVRVDAEAIWLPQRTGAERVPMSVTAVDVVVQRPGSARTVRRTLSAGAARALARLVNDLQVVAPGIRSCPADRGFTDTLAFRYPHGLVRVTAQVTGCGGVTVRRHGAPRLTLGGGARLDHAVTAALGLPRNYGE